MAFSICPKHEEEEDPEIPINSNCNDNGNCNIYDNQQILKEEEETNTTNDTVNLCPLLINRYPLQLFRRCKQYKSYREYTHNFHPSSITRCPL